MLVASDAAGKSESAGSGSTGGIKIADTSAPLYFKGDAKLLNHYNCLEKMRKR